MRASLIVAAGLLAALLGTVALAATADTAPTVSIPRLATGSSGGTRRSP